MTHLIFDYALKVCTLLQLRLGVFDVELIASDEGPILLEVNPRPMGGEMISGYEVSSCYACHHRPLRRNLGVVPTIAMEL
jgi:hypothetical protein